MITFDDPHLPAGTVLKGDYPTGAVQWGKGQWRIHVPEGKFGTFNLALADPKQNSAEFRFYWPRVFVQFDAFNAGDTETIITVRCPEMREVTFTLAPGELRRLRTNWHDPSLKVLFEFKNAEGLLIDNLSFYTD